MVLLQIADGVTTATVADALVRLGMPVRTAPAGTRPVDPAHRVLGPVRPARHAGSVDVFLEAIDGAQSAEVLVVDDGGRRDRACVGDLTAIEAQGAGLAGLVVWGLHRDTREILELDFPVWSLGASPVGPLTAEPRAADALEVAHVGDAVVSTEDMAFADLDGVLFFPAARAEEVLAVAARIGAREREQAEGVRAGRSLREQLGLAAYLAARRADPARTFRQHLRERGGAIEE